MSYELHVPEPPYVPPVPPTPPSPSSSTIETIPRPAFTSQYTLVLYKNSADNRRLDKTEGLSSASSFSISMKEGDNLINPSIIIDSSTDLTKYNYGKITELGRYYYINAERLINTNQYILHMEEDVLMTYKSDILNLVCIVDKQENNFNSYIDDGSYVSQVDDFMNRYSFSKGFSAQPYNILICAGGGESLFLEGTVSTVDSAHITITASQDTVDTDEPVYFFVDAQEGYRVDSVIVTVGVNTYDITDSLDEYGQYHYLCESDDDITVTVTEEPIS